MSGSTEDLTGWLGRGIDIFGFDPFAGATNVKPTRILTATPPAGVIERLRLGTYGYDEIYADSLVDITRKLTIEAGLKGSYSDFSGSISSKFGLSTQRTEKTHFLKIIFNVGGHIYNITRDKEGLKLLLDEDFENALDKYDVDELFKAYGTHLIKKMLVGGRAEYFCQSSDTTSIKEIEFRTAAKLKYKNVGGSLQGTTDVGYVDNTKLKLVQGRETIDTIGGTGKAAVELKTGRWAEWAESCDANPAFLSFDKLDGLMPIWELCVDNKRGEEIRKAYRKMAAKALRTQILSVTSAVATFPDTRVVVPEGYKLLSGGARDNYTGAGSMLTASFPESDNTWRASGKDHGVDRRMKPDPASVTAFALAVYDPDDIWEVQIFHSRPSPQAGHPEQEVEVPSGYVMVGGGAHDEWTGAGNMLVSSYPENNTTWRVVGKDHYQSDHARVTAYAVGLRCNVEGVRIQSKIANGKSNRSGFPQATCAPPAGYKMVGGGAAITYDGPGIMLTASYPTENHQWEGKGKDHGYPDNGTITVYCIGLKVD